MRAGADACDRGLVQRPMRIVGRGLRHAVRVLEDRAIAKASEEQQAIHSAA